MTTLLYSGLIHIPATGEVMHVESLMLSASSQVARLHFEIVGDRAVTCQAEVLLGSTVAGGTLMSLSFFPYEANPNQAVRLCLDMSQCLELFDRAEQPYLFLVGTWKDVQAKKDHDYRLVGLLQARRTANTPFSPEEEADLLSKLRVLDGRRRSNSEA